MIFTYFQYLEHRICFNKISVPFTSPLSVTVGHERIRFQGKGHRSIADRRLHMLNSMRQLKKFHETRQDFLFTFRQRNIHKQIM